MQKINARRVHQIEEIASMARPPFPKVGRVQLGSNRRLEPIRQNSTGQGRAAWIGILRRFCVHRAAGIPLERVGEVVGIRLAGRGELLHRALELRVGQRVQQTLANPAVPEALIIQLYDDRGRVQLRRMKQKGSVPERLRVAHARSGQAIAFRGIGVLIGDQVRVGLFYCGRSRLTGSKAHIEHLRVADEYDAAFGFVRPALPQQLEAARGILPVADILGGRVCVNGVNLRPGRPGGEHLVQQLPRGRKWGACEKPGNTGSCRGKYPRCGEDRFHTVARSTVSAIKSIVSKSSGCNPLVFNRIPSFPSSFEIRVRIERESMRPDEISDSSSATAPPIISATISRAALRTVSVSGMLFSGEVRGSPRGRWDRSLWLPYFAHKPLAGFLAGDLSGRALHNPPFRNHLYVARSHPDRGKHQLLNGPLQLVRALVIELASQFRHHGQCLRPVLIVLNAKRHNTTRIYSAHTVDDGLDIFRKDVLATDDHNVLHTPDHEYLAAGNEAVVAGRVPAIGESRGYKTIGAPITAKQRIGAQLDLARLALGTDCGAIRDADFGT